MRLDVDHLKTWTGRAAVGRDTVTAVPVAALAATLDRHDPSSREGDVLPPLWHWLYFLPLEPQSDLGDDGHAERGTFLPPVPLPRRMWAGGRLEFHRALHVGEAITRTSTIGEVSHKAGRSGDLVFVVVRHEIFGTQGLAITEEHDIVYRDVPAPSDARGQVVQPAPTDPVWRREIVPDPVLLFRYSALTFNGHRIHYDRSYATEVERYPGLIVHGPLVATLLVELLRGHTDRPLERFAFRAVRPMFDTAPFVVCGAPNHVLHDGTGAALWAQDATGALAMQAEARLGRPA